MTGETTDSLCSQRYAELPIAAGELLVVGRSRVVLPLLFSMLLVRLSVSLRVIRIFLLLQRDDRLTAGDFPLLREGDEKLTAGDFALLCEGDFPGEPRKAAGVSFMRETGRGRTGDSKRCFPLM
jgi:hypothetical protein